MIHTMLGPKKSIGILTECADMVSEPFFQQAGWSSRDIPVHVTGMVPDSVFSKLIIGDNPDGDWEQIELCVQEMVQRHMDSYPDTGALLLECSNLAPFTKTIQDIAAVPVFGINQLLQYMDSCINAPNYRALQ